MNHATPQETLKNEPLEKDKNSNDQPTPQQPEQAAGAENIQEDYSIFTPKAKVFIICMTVFSTIFSPLSTSIYLPAITPIARDYDRSVADINLTVTLFQVMQALAPLFFGDLSDQIGRRPVYMMTFTIYIAANVGLALQDNYAALMVLRALQSTGSSPTVAIGSAVVGDLTTSAERGGYIAAVQASIQFAPALAPVLGGVLTQYLGWRSTFWFLLIGAGVFLLIYLPLVPEVSSSGTAPVRMLTTYTDCASGCWKWLHDTTSHQQMPHRITGIAEEASLEG